MYGGGECNQSGYRGRVGLHEQLVATPEIKRLISSGRGLRRWRRVRSRRA